MTTTVKFTKIDLELILRMIIYKEEHIMKMTSAYANKLANQLNDEKNYWREKERSSQTYTASLDEEPVIPDYDYRQVADEIGKIDWKICRIKHAINHANVVNTIDLDGEILTIDMVLVRMAQLNNRRDVLDSMRKRLPKTRTGAIHLRSSAPEYTYLNYDLDQVKADYDKVCDSVMKLQIALDRYNQTVEFEVDID